jgi:hypothetical protein
MDEAPDIAVRPDREGASLPPPARAGARLRLAALLLLGLGCLGSAWLLRGSAAYALFGAGPRDVGLLQQAKLDAPSARHSWIRGLGVVDANTIAFQRRGQPGSFVLGRLIGRPDLWVLLPVPTGTPRYLPPRVLEGQLLAARTMGLRLLPVSRLMQARGAKPGDHLLVVGSRPAEHQVDLLLLLLLTALGLIASARFALLMLPARGARGET